MRSGSFFLKCTKIMMILLGLWPFKLSNKMLAILYIVYSKTINANFVIFVVTITIGWICAIMSSGEEKADSLLYVLEYAFTAWKMFLVRSAPAKKLLKEVFSLRQTRMASDSGIKRIHCDFSRYNFKMFCSLLIVTTITLILFILHAYGSWQLWREQELQGMEPKRTLIFPEWLPFDKVKMFDVIYFYQIWNASLAAGLIVGTDVVFVSLVSFTSVRLRVLGYKMRNFGREIEDEFKNNSEIFRNLILEHKDIIRYVTDLNDSLKFYFLVDFLAKSYHISIILFNMLVVFKASKLGFTLYMTETVLLFVEVTNLYTQANDLSLNSEKFGLDIFECGWYKQTPEIKKSLHIMMLRAQRPLKLESGGVIILGNELLLKIFRAAYTYILFSNQISF